MLCFSVNICHQYYFFHVCNVFIEPSEKEFPLEQYNYLVTVWRIFSCDSGAAYCSKDEEVRIFSFSICPLREDRSLSQRAFLLYARSYINPQLTCPQKTAIIKCSRFQKLQFLWDCPFSEMNRNANRNLMEGCFYEIFCLQFVSQWHTWRRSVPR